MQKDFFRKLEQLARPFTLGKFGKKDRSFRPWAKTVKRTSQEVELLSKYCTARSTAVFDVFVVEIGKLSTQLKDKKPK